MNLGIIAPTDDELVCLNEFLKLNGEDMRSSRSFMMRTGFVDNIRQDAVSVITSGMGKVNTAVTAQYLIDMGCSSLVLFGTAGALEDTQEGTVIVPNVILSHDSDTELASQVMPFEDVFRPDVSMYNLVRECAVPLKIDVDENCIISSGDYFISDPSDLFTAAQFVDMESYAFMQTCARNNVQGLVIKSVTNHADVQCYDSEDAGARNAALLTAVFAFNYRDTSLNLTSLSVPEDMLENSRLSVDLHPDWKIYPQY